MRIVFLYSTDSAKEAIPEGFFDDPKLDAKVHVHRETCIFHHLLALHFLFPSPPIQARKVEYKDKMEEEWEMFQKSIQKESDVRP